MGGAAGVVVGAAMAACGSAGSSGLEKRAAEAARQRSDQARAAARQAGLSTDVQDFVADAAGASGQRFTVVYDLSGRKATFTQRPPFRRLEVEDTPVQGDAQAAIVNAGGSFSCRRTSSTWTCQADGTPNPPVGALSTDDMVAGVQSLTASGQQFDLRVDRTRVAGVAARCLLATARAGAAPPSSAQRLCIAADGAPLLVETAGQSVKATSFTTSAPGSAFDLPAKPTSSTTTG